MGSLNQNITFPQPGNVAFGSSSVSMGASAVPSGLTVTYALGAGTTNSACTVSSLGAVTVLAVGTCEVTASQAGDSQYAAASDVSRAFQVVPAKATAPTITSASASSQAITVGVVAPGFTGGVSISGYELVATPTGGGTTVTDTSCTSSPCTISGLVNGTEYTVTAAAINSAGTGNPSTASTPLTPATAAFAVGALAATPGDTTVTLTWVPLTNAQLGGGTFTRYEVNYRTAGSGSWTPFDNNVSGQSTSTIVVTGLDNGTSYDFQVVAFTSANFKEIAGNTAEVVQYPSTVPSAPQSLATLAATATDVQFSWAPPLRDGGASVTGYTATVTSTSPGASTPITCTVTGTTPRCTASNLTNGAVYTFSVTAENRMGSSVAATKTYTVPNDDATLFDLVVTGSAGAVVLSPSFAVATSNYTAEVGNGVESVTITPTTTDGGAQVTVDGVLVTSGEASASIALIVGETEIDVEVTASDPRFTETYTITITRAPAPAPAPGPSPSDGGGSTPVDPVTPPAQVMDGEDVAVVMEGEEMVTVVLQPTAQQDGWEAVGSGFDVVVRTEMPSGAPVPLANDRRLAVPQGGIVQAAGDGYMADSLVRVFMIPRSTARAGSSSGVMPRSVDGAMFLGETSVDAAGEFAASFTVPLSVAIGDYVLQINGMAASAAVRSVNMGLMVEPGAAPMQAGMMQRAGFYQGLSDELSKSGQRKMRALVESMPADAQAVQVLVTGVSVSLESFEDNLALAGKRASKLAAQMKAAGVSGEYTVNVSSTFTVDAAERSLAGKADVLTTKTGKPLSTVTVLFQEPM
ncbi:MAG TPA: fibronectin type III domain-containing protein [Acidimicrobiia bacterium]